MHLGETLLKHIKDCEKCQLRYAFVMQNKILPISTAIIYADYTFIENQKEKHRRIKNMRSEIINKCKVCDIELKLHNGFMGYSCMFCPNCGYYVDHDEEGQNNEFIGKTK